MRIISQGGKLSIDEQESIIAVNETMITIRSRVQEKILVLGDYKTKERAMEVFGELHAAYEELPFSGNTVFYMPKE